MDIKHLGDKCVFMQFQEELPGVAFLADFPNAIETLIMTTDQPLKTNMSVREFRDRPPRIQECRDRMCPIFRCPSMFMSILNLYKFLNLGPANSFLGKIERATGSAAYYLQVLLRQ